jgi:hypothetical protein
LNGDQWFKLNANWFAITNLDPHFHE